jgi:hypothetical protein
MSSKVIDIFQNLNFVSDFNANGLVTNNGLKIDGFGRLSLYNTSPSINSSTGAFYISGGGLAINNDANATSIDNGGALTIKGGAAISNNVYIGGDLTVTGSILYADSTSASSTFAYLTLTATDESINLSTGALVVTGGISIQADLNATSSTAGGGLTVSGGAGIKQDLYVGGSSYLPTIISTNISSTNAKFTNVTVGVLNATGITATNINFTGSLFQNGSIYISSQWSTFANDIAYTTGNVGINTTSPTYKLDVNGDFRVSANGTLNVIENNTASDIIQLRNTNSTGYTSLQFLNNSSTAKMFFGYGNASASTFQNTAYLNTISGVPINFVAGGNTSTPIIINAADNSLSITSLTQSTTTSSGALKISGGASIIGNLFVGGTLNVNSSNAVSVLNTTISSNSSTGAMLLIGGLSINIFDTTNSNATSYTAGSGLTIAGGTAISQDLYVGGILDIKSGSNNLNSVNIQSIQMYSNSAAGTYSVIGSGNSSRSAASFTPLRFTGWNDQTNPKMTINTNTIDFVNAINGTHNSNTIGNIFTTGGNVGINVIPNAPLQFISDTASRKIVLYEDANNNHQFYGYGMGSSLMRYQVGGTGSDHVFFAGVNSTTSNELFRIKGTGNIIVAGTSNSVATSSGNIYSTNLISTNITTSTLNASNGITAGNINFTGSLFQNGSLYSSSQWSGTTGTTLFYGTTGSGALVGIGTSTPTFTLDVAGDSRISTSLTTGSLFSTNSTINNGVFTNLSSGILNATNLTTGNINFTGILSQNGTPYLGSQWYGTTGTTLYYGTTGSGALVGIGTSTPAFTLDVNGPIRSTTLILSGTSGSLNSTTASLVFHDISISSTDDASSFTRGGAITIAGGLAVQKSLAIGGTMILAGVSNDIAGTFAAANNIAVPTAITGLLYPTANIRSFTVTISIQQTATTNLYTQITIEGIQTVSGWSITDSYIGDDISIFFTIDSTGQIFYTSSNVAGWVSTTLNYRSTSFSIAANYIQSNPPTSGNLTVTGNLTVNSTTDATTIGVGSIISNGGISVSKSVNIGNSVIMNNTSSMSSGTFAAVNSQATPANITGLLIDSSTFTSFSLIMTVILLRTSGGNFKAQYTIEGVQKDSGWAIYTTNLGDTIDLTFSIVSGTGQLQYSSGTTYTNFTSLTFNYQVNAFYTTSGGLNTFSLPAALTTLTLTGVANSTDTSTGTLIVNGGTAIQKNLNVGGSISASSFIGPIYTTQSVQASLSRSFATNYQNTSTRAIFVSICVNAGVQSEEFTVFSDTSSTPTTVVVSFSIFSNGSNMCFIVLPNNYYRLTRSSTATIVSWTEWS